MVNPWTAGFPPKFFATVDVIILGRNTPVVSFLKLQSVQQHNRSSKSAHTSKCLNKHCSFSAACTKQIPLRLKLYSWICVYILNHNYFWKSRKTRKYSMPFVTKSQTYLALTLTLTLTLILSPNHLAKKLLRMTNIRLANKLLRMTSLMHFTLWIMQQGMQWAMNN